MKMFKFNATLTNDRQSISDLFIEKQDKEKERDLNRLT